MSTEFASREQFMALKNRRYDVVESLGIKFRIQSLSEAEKSAFETEVYFDGEKRRRERMLNAKRKLVILCLVDEAGAALLDDDDVSELGEVDGVVISAIYDAAFIHCGFAKGDVDNLAKKNSAETPDGGSLSE